MAGEANAMPEVVLGVVAVASVIGAVCAFVVRSGHRDRVRVESLRDWAAAHAFDFTDRDDALARRFGAAPFGIGRARRCRHVMRGVLAGMPLTMFDYSYATASQTATAGMDAMTSATTDAHRVQVLALDVPVDWPEVTVTPHGLFSRLAVGLGGQDLEVGHEAFDRDFRVRAVDERAASEFLRPMAPTLERFADQVLRIERGSLLLLRPGRLEPAELDGWIGGLEVALPQTHSEGEPSPG